MRSAGLRKSQVKIPSQEAKKNRPTESNEPMRDRKRKRRWLVVVGLVVMVIGGVLVLKHLLGMPGKSFAGTAPAFDEAALGLRKQLEADVRTLAAEIGERNTIDSRPLKRAARWVESRLASGGGTVARQEFDVGGVTCENLELELGGGAQKREIVIVGAHYDSAPGTPGADDNGSGVAALLALAERLRGVERSRTLRFVAFTNEEPPHFQGTDMGSLRYAKRCRERGENVVAMLSLETIGYFSDAEGSQKYPFPLSWFYPSQGNFIGFVGDRASGDLTRRVVASFRTHGHLPSEGAVLPSVLPGVGWSDHWSFWQSGYPAVMVTDTAPFRNPNYHESSDLPDTLDYDRFTRVVLGLEKVIAELVL